jgi:transposase
LVQLGDEARRSGFLRPSDGTMNQQLLPDWNEEPPSPADVSRAEKKTDGGSPRLRVPQRDQIEMHWASLDELLEPDHQARIVWAAVCGLDLSRWLNEIKAVEGHVGRDATDPRLLVALWVYATLDGVGHAREVARLCMKHLAYQWLCGEVTVNYHLLSDFRSRHGDKWDDLLTQIVGSLLSEDLVTIKRVAQDGMKVRASAGKSSFRRSEKLQECLEEARQQVEALKQQEDESPDQLSKRQRASRERAAAERTRRMEQALENCNELQQQREKTGQKNAGKVKEARSSTTDPEARVMQFSDGGFRPGYNVQFSTDTATGLIVGVATTNAGNDFEQLPPMLEQVESRYGINPEEVLVDGGFASLPSIESSELRGTKVYAPPKQTKKQRAEGKDIYARKPGDSDAVAGWRARMGEEAAKLLYVLRCQTAEWVNAICRNRGFWQMPVRGKEKCHTAAVLHAITHDLLIGVKLRAAAAMQVK